MRILSGCVTAGWLLSAAAPALAQDISLATNAGGIVIGGTKPAWSTGFGAVNGLGIGTPGTGQTILTPGGGTGVLYTTPYNIAVSDAAGNRRVVVRAYVSTAFVHSSILQVYSCVSSCNTAANFSALSTSLASPSDVIGSPGLSSNQTVTRYLAVFVANSNGAAAFTGIDFATIIFNVYSNNDGLLKHTYTLALNNPIENVQTALRFTLATAPAGLTISPGPAFSLAYGGVNGLGIGPGAGLTTTSSSGGTVYSTPYVLQPQFSSFSSTTGTINTYVSTDFVHASDLELRDSSNGMSFSAISKSPGSPTVLTSSAASGSTVTRYLGLFVSRTNGPAAFTGADNAMVTFTLVVP
jgi:hypothetical protein